MAIVPKYDPVVDAARANGIALSRAIDEFSLAMTKRIQDAVRDELIPEWWDVNNMAQLQTMHDNLCAIEIKTRQNLLDISGLSLILLNFVDESTLEDAGSPY